VGTLIDSSIFIAAERGDTALRAALARLDNAQEFFISAVTVFELLHGVHRADTPARKVAREAHAERFIQAIPVLSFDEGVARVLAPLDASLMSSGNKLPIEDLMIAATALAHGHCVATRDRRSFQRIAGLQVEDW
jgi:predicted nucleic acid-binding protein